MYQLHNIALILFVDFSNYNNVLIDFTMDTQFNEKYHKTEADGQIIQQFQIQLNDQQAQIVEHIPVMATTGPGGHTQQFQIVQTDPSKPSEQPQIITLYTWGGN